MLSVKVLSFRRESPEFAGLNLGFECHFCLVNMLALENCHGSDPWSPHVCNKIVICFTKQINLAEKKTLQDLMATSFLWDKV